MRHKTDNDFTWTDETVALCTKLWLDGLTGSQIAAKVGAPSRSTIIGKLYRLGVKRPVVQRAWPYKAPPSKPAPRAVKAAAPKPKPRPNNLLAANLARRATLERPVFAEPAPVIIDATHAKPWTQRAFGECAYPIGGEGAETLSCCAPTAGKTYCAGHRAIMFRPPADPRTLERMAGKLAA